MKKYLYEVCKILLDNYRMALAQSWGLPPSIGPRCQKEIHFFISKKKIKGANFLHTEYQTLKLICFEVCIPLAESTFPVCVYLLYGALLLGCLFGLLHFLLRQLLGLCQNRVESASLKYQEIDKNLMF